MSRQNSAAAALAGEAARLLTKLRAERPLVQAITNYVSMDVAANALLAIGASPAMVHATDEVEDFVAIASALTVNIGTLSTDWVVGMLKAAKAAGRLGKPWVLDPVGVGATRFRDETTRPPAGAAADRGARQRLGNHGQRARRRLERGGGRGRRASTAPTASTPPAPRRSPWPAISAASSPPPARSI